jgi:Ca-activated chloride channel family protein
VAIRTQNANGLQLAGTLSQSKLVQGSNGIVYLDLSITAPMTTPLATAYRPSDIIVVLDRSGSMAAENKLPYAKEAVRSLIGQLQPEDRFALVTFDSQATVSIALTPVTEAVRAQIANQLDGLRPGDATNISDGLLQARALFADRATTRNRRVILLSDGETNRGIVDPQELGKLAASFSQYGAVLSTIGMGLGFNETLMASLADYGMGHYAYLEHLATLGDILQKDLHDAQQVYANASYIDIDLGDGVTVRDAGGYPTDLTSQPGTVRILTGQLLGGAKKQFVMTLQAPTADIGNVQLGAVTLHYTTDSGDSSIALPADALQVAVLEPARRGEAVASIDKELYRHVWEGNNLGRMQKTVSHWLRRGDQKKAEEAIATYRDELRQAETAADVPMSSPATEQTLSTLEQDVHDAFVGAAPQQEIKRNRAAKEQHQKALQQQRSY